MLVANGGACSVEIAQETGIETQDLDLHSGFNILKYCIFDVMDNPSDLVL
ncbi:MAG: hypothetical protein JO189_26780 [Deltaproteobacteria bacterium]|nr:hypothetical protein [Deltaproteobacteria bacterium]